MGINNLNARSDGQIVFTDDVNQYRTALNQDVVPRSASGVPTDLSGGLGQTVFRWARSFFQSISIGTAATGLNIKENAGRISFETSGVERLSIGATGISDNQIFGPSLAANARFKAITVEYGIAGAYTLTLPTNALEYMIIYGHGGGGGGAAGNTTIEGGSGGGGSKPETHIVKNFMALSQPTINITVGSGGAGGVGNSANGANGTRSRVVVGTTTVPWAINFGFGLGGLGAGGDRIAVITGYGLSTAGGLGGTTASPAGKVPAFSDFEMFDTGLSTPTGGASSLNVSGGGAGGNGRRFGGNGGTSSISPTPGASGGGGGGGGGNGSSGPDSGAAGASGYVAITYFVEAQPS